MFFLYFSIYYCNSNLTENLKLGQVYLYFISVKCILIKLMFSFFIYIYIFFIIPILNIHFSTSTEN